MAAAAAGSPGNYGSHSSVFAAGGLIFAFKDPVCINYYG
jgi:hypothetical protein